MIPRLASLGFGCECAMPGTYNVSPMITQPNREEGRPRLASLGFGIACTIPGEEKSQP